MHPLLKGWLLVVAAFAFASCDIVAPADAPPQTTASGAVALAKADPGDDAETPVPFAFSLDGDDVPTTAVEGGWVAFPAQVLNRNGGDVTADSGRLWFPTEVVEAAVRKTRTLRYLETGGGAEWVRGFTASVPDLNEVEQDVLAWLYGRQRAASGSGPVTYAEFNCRAEQLDPSDPACNDQDPENCWATVCDGGGGGEGGWPPPNEDPPDPPDDDPPPGDGGGGSGNPGDPGGPGSPGDDCDPNAIDQPPHCDPVEPPGEEQGPQVANGNEMRAEIMNQCSTVNDNGRANNVFQGSVRASLNAVYASVSPSPNHGVFVRYPTRTIPNHHGGGPRDLDGYVYSNFGGEALTSAILEVKNSSNITDRNVRQAQDHITYLSSQRRPGADWAPTYFYASHAGENNPRLVALAAFANARGVNLAHISIHWTSSNRMDLKFESGIVGTVMDGSGPLAWWHQVLFRIDRTYNFRVACNNPET